MSPQLSRRAFLKLSTLATGASVLGFPSLLKAENAGTTLNIGIIGLGVQGLGRMKEFILCGKRAKIVALCDVDRRCLEKARVRMLEIDPNFPIDEVTDYDDFRRLLAEEKHLDAVVITTPDHWHYHMAKASLKAGKHIFCEKPLTRTIAEARELRSLATKSKLVTQMGNHGSSSRALRRGIEVIQGGVLGPVREVTVWPPKRGFYKDLKMPESGDPVPEGLNWDAWLGPAPSRLYKANLYHPSNWRAWYDFGCGMMGDFGCHSLNLPVRALKLGYPESVEVQADHLGGPAYPADATIHFEFPRRGDLPSVKVEWFDQGLPAGPLDGILPPSVLAYFGADPVQAEKLARDGGVLIRGENGFTFGNHWDGAVYLQLNGDEKLSGLFNHPACKSIPEAMPRSPGHVREWVEACLGGPAVFSNFETGGYLTEITLAGVLAARVGKKLQWDGAAMKALNAPEADSFIHTTYRTEWL